MRNFLKKWTEDRKNKKLRRFQDIFELGFDKIEFPIIIKDGHDLNIVYTFKDFCTDPDLYFHEFDDVMKLIDSKGQQFSWGYNKQLETNYPDRLEGTLTIENVRQLFEYYFEKAKKRPHLGEEKNIKELIDRVADYF